MTWTRCLLLGLSTLALLATAHARQGAEWKEFTSKEGRFKASFPGKPTEGQQQVPSAVGNLTLYTFLVETGQGKNGYGITYSDYPANFQKKSDEAVLDGVRDGIPKGLKGKLLTEKKITLGKIPGRDVRRQLPLTFSDN